MVELLLCTASLPGQWDSFCTPPHRWGALGSETPFAHNHTVREQWAVGLLLHSATLLESSGQWNSLSALPHCRGAVDSETPFVRCHTAGKQRALGHLQCTAGVVWSGVVWRGVAWCGVVWRDVLIICFQACMHFDVEKVKTIGDCYMCVTWGEDLETAAVSAQDMLKVANEFHRIISWAPLNGQTLAVRVGMHIGPAVSGIIGRTKFAFDIWGVCPFALQQTGQRAE